MTEPLHNLPIIDRMLHRYARAPGHPSKLRVLRILRRLLRKGRVTVDAEFGRMALSLDDFVQHQIFWHGCYEPATLSLVLRLLDGGGCLVDVGANVGQFSIAAARKLNGRGRVVAIEPNPEICSQLLDNRRLNGLQLQIEVVGAALTNGRRLIEFGVPPRHNLGQSREALPTETDKFRAAGLPLGELLEELDINAVQVLKIDVEGAELSVIQGLFMKVPRMVPANIVFEYIPESFHYGTAPDDLLSLLRRNGYEILTVRGEPYSPGQELPENNVWARMADAKA